MDLDRLEEAYEDDEQVWSVSRIHTAMLCGRKYRLKYVDKIPEPTTPQLSFGTAVHKSIEKLHSTNKWDDADMQRLWSDEWYAAQRGMDWDTTFLRRDDYDKKGILILEAYRSKHLNDEWYALESTFQLDTGDGTPALRGALDKIMRLTENPDVPPEFVGRLGVVDYKTGKYPPDPLVLAVDPQLTIYHWAAKQILGEDVVIGIHHLPSELVKPRKNDPPPVMFWSTRTDNHMKEVLNMLSAAVKRVNEKQFERNIDFHCRSCPFKEICLGGLINGES